MASFLISLFTLKAIRASVLFSVVLAAALGQNSVAPTSQRLSALPSARIRDIVVGNDQNIYVIGTTDSLTFPVTPNGFQATLPGGRGFLEGFLLKLDSTGSHVLYGTYLNGLVPNRLAVDDSGFMYVLSDHYEQPPDDVAFNYPASFPFPISENAAQTEAGFPTTSVVVVFYGGGTIFSQPGVAVSVK